MAETHLLPLRDGNISLAYYEAKSSLESTPWQNLSEELSSKMQTLQCTTDGGTKILSFASACVAILWIKN